MKKILNILPLFLLLSFISCGEHENDVYSGNINGSTFLSFDKSLYDLGIAIDGEGLVNIPLKSSTTSSSDRIYSLELITDDSSADPLTYNLPTSVTIPANEYVGNIVITGQDLGLVEVTPKNIVFKVVGLSETEFMDNSQITVRVYEFCPIPEEAFTGDYLLEEITPFVDGPTLDHGQVITIVATSSTGRSFATRNYPNYCSPTMIFTFNLVCNEVIVDPNQSSTCACTSSGLFFGPTQTPSSYNVDDDSVFHITFTNDVTSDCGTTVQTTYKLTKQ